MAIKAYLEVFIENVIKEYKDRLLPTIGDPSSYLSKKSSKGQLKPFHAAIIPPELLRINAFERGFSTSLGSTFEECARLIGSEHHKKSERQYSISGYVPIAGMNEIERQVRRFEHAAEEKGHKPTMDEMIASVLNAKSTDTISLTINADVYFMTHNNNEYFFEIKSPMPNKGQCLEILQRLLRFHLIKKKPRPAAGAYFCMGYNPYGPTKDLYKWSFAKTYFPLQEASYIGYEFWNVVGGRSAYKDLISIYQEVGREKMKYMLDSLAFGF